MKWLSTHKTYLISGIVLVSTLVIVLIALYKISKFNHKNYDVFVSPLEVDDCKREHAQGYVNGYKNGISAYCESGIDITEIPATSQMCYDTGYERGFIAGVELAHKSPAQCENRAKLQDHIPIDEAELK